MSLIPRDGFFELDKVFDNFFAPSRYYVENPQKAFFSPHVDIVEKDEWFEIRADLPGVKKDDIQVRLEKGVLSIEATHNEEDQEERDGRVIRRERRTGKFFRSFNLGTQVNDADISADFIDGVLTIRAPKMSATVPEAKRIDIA